MKSTKPPTADSHTSSHRRSQPVRQTRTNPPRSSAAAARSGASRDTLGGGGGGAGAGGILGGGGVGAAGGAGGSGAGPLGDQPIDIFPAITHFADAITALPKELVRHFTLLKEVEAKIFAPEEQLFKLIAAARRLPVPEARTNNEVSSSTSAPRSATSSAQGSSNGGTPSIQQMQQQQQQQQQAQQLQHQHQHQLRRRLQTAALGDEPSSSSGFEPSNIQRRQLFRQTAFKIQEMLVSLEEKNHVISTANEALQRQLARVEDVWPYLEGEFSDEAKWGSTTHWAYPDNRNGKAAQAERTRRDGAAAISAAAQALAEQQAATRSDSRKQAAQAKKTQKPQPQPQPHESDADDLDARNHNHNLTNSTTANSHGNAAAAATSAASNTPASNNQGGKKSQPSKVRKTAESGNVGLGISNATSTNGNPPTKRRKVEKEKPPLADATQERATNKAIPTATASASAMTTATTTTMTTTTAPEPKSASPRGTPVPEPPKKRKALPTGSGQSKRRLGAAAANAPSTTTSPLMGSAPEPKAPSRPSPPTSAAATRPATSRARQNSLQSMVENGKTVRPATAVAAAASASAVTTAAFKTGGNGANPPDSSQPSTWPRPVNESKAPKEVPVTVKAEPIQEDPAEQNASQNPPSSLPTPAAHHGRRDSRAAEDSDRRSESLQATLQHSTSNSTVTTTKSGRASKPSTPHLPSAFQEPSRASRTTRNADPPSNNSNHTAGAKKNQQQKKGGAAVQNAAAAAARRSADQDGPSTAQGDEEEEDEEGEDGEIDADEPTYCYCNSVSYGEMVACDSDDCAREWFHLACVGLKVAPSSKTKWYCEDCKERLKAGGKKASNR